MDRGDWGSESSSSPSSGEDVEILLAGRSSFENCSAVRLSGVEDIRDSESRQGYGGELRPTNACR